MIFKSTYLFVLDNSSANEVMCIKVYNKKNIGNIGDKVLVVVKRSIVNIKLIGKIKPISKSDKVKAVIVHLKKKLNRKNGTFLKFDNNYCIMLNKDNFLIGTRILGPVPFELKFNSFGKRLLSLAPAIV